MQFSYRYKKPEERGPLNEAMHLLFPMMYQLCVRLLPDQSEQSVLLQKQILKIYFALTQVSNGTKELEFFQLTLPQTFIVVAAPLDTTQNTHTHTLFFHTYLIIAFLLSLCLILQYSLPLDLISREAFSQWMEIVRAVADRPVPEQTNAVDEEDRVDLPWWKCKKWALHILHRMFERSD